MYRLGLGMFAASNILAIGWVLYRLWQAGAQDVFMAVLIVVLFVGGITTAAISDKNK